MKTEWDSYLDQQLTNHPTVRQAYEEETKVLSIGVQLAKQRKRKGLTQAKLAKKIGTSTPQLSRTERRPENVNMRTLILARLLHSRPSSDADRPHDRASLRLRGNCEPDAS